MSNIVDKKDRLSRAYRYLIANEIVSKKQDLADKMGVNKSSVSRAFSGSDSYLTDSFLDKFNDSVGGIFDMNWLLTGKGSMLIVGDGNNSHNSDSFIGVSGDENGNNRGNTTTNNFYGGCSEKEEQEQAKEMLIDFRPRVPIDAAAGSLAVIADDGVRASECEMYPKIGQLPAYDFTTFVRGDSMEPRFERGAEIACKRVNSSGFIQWGRVHVLDTSQGAVIKQIYDDGDNIRCKSFNPIYPDFLVPKEEIYSINLVVGKLTFE